MESPIVTKDIVNEFIRDYLEEKGHSWQPARSNSRRNRKSDNQSFNTIRRCLAGASNELQEFIETSYKESFQDTTNYDLDEFSFEHLKELADELFSEGTSWSTILTFLVHGAALSCKAITLHQDDSPEKGSKMVSKIIDWISKYIDENLLGWIEEQDGGWLSVQDYVERSAMSNGGLDGQSAKRRLRNHFGVAAFAVLVGGLYLCSKFSSQ